MPPSKILRTRADKPQTPQRLALIKEFWGTAPSDPKNFFRVGMQQGGGSLGRHANEEAWACDKMRRRGRAEKGGTEEKGGGELFSSVEPATAVMRGSGSLTA